jgi:hypothetical protein
MVEQHDEPVESEIKEKNEKQTVKTEELEI